MKVRDIALKAAKDHALVLYHPEPAVMLRDFGKEGFTFDLKVFVGDVMSGARVASDIRLAVLAAFKENGVALPIVVRDVPVSEPENQAKT